MELESAKKSSDLTIAVWHEIARILPIVPGERLSPLI